MLLFLDTSDFEKVRVSLVGEKVIDHWFSSQNLSETLLPEIKKFLSKHKVNLKQIKNIAVVLGPGGFSRIRTAVAVANGLSFGLKIGILGIAKANLPKDLKKLKLGKVQRMVKPLYDREPNITLSKNR